MPNKSLRLRTMDGVTGLLLGSTMALTLLAIGPPALAASDDVEVGCLAKAIYFESRGESRFGMLAVGHVVMNRTRDRRFPRGICAVVNQGAKRGRGCQFSYACDGLSDQPKDRAMWEES